MVQQLTDRFWQAEARSKAQAIHPLTAWGGGDTIFPQVFGKTALLVIIVIINNRAIFPQYIVFVQHKMNNFYCHNYDSRGR